MPQPGAIRLAVGGVPAIAAIILFRREGYQPRTGSRGWEELCFLDAAMWSVF